MSSSADKASSDRSPRLDPGARRALEVADLWPNVPLEELTPVQARDEMDRQLGLAGDPEPVAEVRDLSVMRTDGSRLPLRIYAASTAKPIGVALFFHGGGWSVGSLQSHDGLCRSIAIRAGTVVVSVDYRLAPEHPFPAGLDDCLLAAEWVEGNLGALGVSGSRTVVVGDSAGGNLAAAVCLRRLQLGQQQPSGQVLIYPGLDPGCTATSHREAGGRYFITREAAAVFWSWYLGDTGQARNPLAAPLTADSLEGLAPALIITAEFDPLRDEGEAYGRAMEAAGVEVCARRYDGQIHGFLTWDRYIEQAREARDEVGRWIRSRFCAGHP